MNSRLLRPGFLCNRHPARGLNGKARKGSGRRKKERKRRRDGKESLSIEGRPAGSLRYVF